MSFPRDVAVIGGAGRVGLPLALILADSGRRTVIYDINEPVVAQIRRGEMPFKEQGAGEMLRRALASNRLEVVATPELIAECRHLVLIVGTPVDEHLNPSFDTIHRALDGCRPYLRDGQTLILRSTVYPGITAHVQDRLRHAGLQIRVAFCPERVAQGNSLREFRELPQIISAFEPQTLDEVRELLGPFTPEFIEMAPVEAELAKLMTNAWRYIQFAISNQFFMIATEQGLDFERILHGCRHDYPRMAGMPGAGLAAGPCLMKDTMQLAAFSPNMFPLGHAAMRVNEGLPHHLVQLAKRQVDLPYATAGILGMAFKAGSDDVRDSLSYKLKKLLTLEAARVICTDPFVRDERLLPLDQVLAESDVLFLATPHAEYRTLAIPAGKKLIDPWNFVGLSNCEGPRS